MQEISYITERIELTLGENTTLQYLLSNVASMPYKEGKILLNNCLECLEVKIHRKCTTNCECNVQAMCVFFGEWKPSVGILKLLLFRLIHLFLIKKYQFTYIMKRLQVSQNY